VGIALAQTEAPRKIIKRVSAEPPQSEQGVDMFKQYCAACHGTDARGTGPAADALKKRPADLTQLSRKNNGAFPRLHVQNFIKGDEVLAAHGTREMPVWGNILGAVGGGDSVETLRVYSLMKYLESIQTK
jgi:mono/diheme cytochrome c family protein